MLVLVLILVVIALVLLLAGWFLHLVVLAWTSVGISVLAGLVLLYDWWQTRSAVRAGRQGSGAPATGTATATVRCPGRRRRAGSVPERPERVRPEHRRGPGRVRRSGHGAGHPGAPGRPTAVEFGGGDRRDAGRRTVRLPRSAFRRFPIEWSFVTERD